MRIRPVAALLFLLLAPLAAAYADSPKQPRACFSAEQEQTLAGLPPEKLAATIENGLRDSDPAVREASIIFLASLINRQNESLVRQAVKNVQAELARLLPAPDAVITGNEGGPLAKGFAETDPVVTRDAREMASRAHGDSSHWKKMPFLAEAFLNDRTWCYDYHLEALLRIIASQQQAWLQAAWNAQDHALDEALLRASRKLDVDAAARMVETFAAAKDERALALVRAYGNPRYSARGALFLQKLAQSQNSTLRSQAFAHLTEFPERGTVTFFVDNLTLWSKWEQSQALRNVVEIATPDAAAVYARILIDPQGVTLAAAAWPPLQDLAMQSPRYRVFLKSIWDRLDRQGREALLRLVRSREDEGAGGVLAQVLQADPERFLRAVEANDQDEVRKLLAQGADVNARKMAFRGWRQFYSDRKDSDLPATALIRASIQGNLAMVRMLVEHGAKLESVDNFDQGMRMTALGYALMNRQFEIARYLIEQGANPGTMVNRKRVYGNGSSLSGDAPALAYCIREGYFDFAELLLAHGAKAEDACVLPPRDTALILAARQGQARLARRLVAQGADPNAANWDKVTALMVACGEGNSETVAALLAVGAQPGKVNAASQSALSLAAGRGRLDMVRMVEAKLAPRAAEALIRRAGFEASACGQVEILKHFAARGVDLSGAGSQGETWTMAAAKAGQMATLDYLTAGGAGVKARDRRGETAVHWAIRGGQQEAVRFLHRKGAGLDDPNQDGETPLMLAAKLGDLAMLKSLLADGADRLCPDHASALDCAGTTEVACFLGAGKTTDKGTVRSRSPLLKSQLLEAIHQKDMLRITQLAKLADLRGPVKAEGHDDWTLAMAGAESGDLGIMKILVENGADVRDHHDEETEGGICRQSVMTVALESNLKLAEYLLGQGADAYPLLAQALVENDEARLSRYARRLKNINVNDPNGESLLMAACRTRKLELVKLLVGLGADVNYKYNYVTYDPEDPDPPLAVDALCVAVEHESQAIVDWLLAHGAQPKEAALVYAIRNHRLGTMRDFGRKGARPGGRALIEACRYAADENGAPDAAAAAWVLAQGVNVNARDGLGRTPLMLAVQGDNLPLVRLLLGKGANRKLKDKEGKTAADYAGENTREEIAALLR